MEEFVRCSGWSKRGFLLAELDWASLELELFACLLAGK